MQRHLAGKVVHRVEVIERWIVDLVANSKRVSPAALRISVNLDVRLRGYTFPLHVAAYPRGVLRLCLIVTSVVALTLCVVFTPDVTHALRLIEAIFIPRPLESTNIDIVC